jgi:serine protease Do
LLTARLLGRDPATDLAVLRVEARGLTTAPFADSDAVRIGEWVLAIGSPFALRRTVTVGVVSGKGRNGLGVNPIEDYLQTDAAIHPGNSGGPLVNLDGQIVGITTLAATRSGGIGFAVPSTMARMVTEQMLAKGKVERCWAGVAVQELTPDLAKELRAPSGAGALVNHVQADSPAEHANLKNGDIILSFNGKPLLQANDFLREILFREADRPVPLEVLRNGKKYGANLTPLLRKEASVPLIPAQLEGTAEKHFGLSLREFSASAAAAMGMPSAAFCQVSAITVGSTADRAGIQVGDGILEADGKAAATLSDVYNAFGDGHALLRLRRKDTFFYVALRKSQEK